MTPEAQLQCLANLLEHYPQDECLGFTRQHGICLSALSHEDLQIAVRRIYTGFLLGFCKFGVRDPSSFLEVWGLA